MTPALLALGIAGRNLSNGTLNTRSRTTSTRPRTAPLPQPNAVIRLQRVKDVPYATAGAAGTNSTVAVSLLGAPSPLSTDYWPLALYDTREAVKRDEAGAIPTTSVVIGGVMYYVELDTNNLAKWFLGATAPFNDGVGSLAKNDNNGFIVYFSDRRNNRNAANKETAEFGNEDIINPTSSTGAANGTLDAGEDVNAFVPVAPATYTPVLDTYGTLPSYTGTLGNGTTTGVPPCTSLRSYGFLGPTAKVNNIIAGPDATTISTNAAILRGNRPIFFRRALKLTGGNLLRTAGISGLTIASENPVYVEGNYNVSNPANFATEAHIGAGDHRRRDRAAVEQLERHQLVHPDAQRRGRQRRHEFGGRHQLPLRGRLGQVDLVFARAGHQLDAGNRLRERRRRPQPPAHARGLGRQHLDYRGSIVSFFISRQATGIYKSGTYVYGAPGTRNFNFDIDFLLPDKLPPGTPMFRDVNTLTFRQLLASEPVDRSSWARPGPRGVTHEPQLLRPLLADGDDRGPGGRPRLRRAASLRGGAADGARPGRRRRRDGVHGGGHGRGAGQAADPRAGDDRPRRSLRAAQR